MSKEDLEDLSEMDNIKYLSSDTETFRVTMMTKMIQFENKLNGFGCIADRETVKKHEAKLEELSKSNNDLSTNVKLLTQAVELGNKNVIEAIGRLDTGRKDNAESIKTVDNTITIRIKKTEEDITAIQKDIIEKSTDIKSAIKTAIICISVGWVLMVTVVSVVIWAHDRVPHDKETPKEVTWIDKYYSSEN